MNSEIASETLKTPKPGKTTFITKDEVKNTKDVIEILKKEKINVKAKYQNNLIARWQQ